MRQRIKQFLLTVVLCLMLIVLIPFSVLAKVDQKIPDSIEQGAKKNISTIMNFDEATLQNYVDQFEANGETKMADSLKGWQTTREDAGDVTAVDDAVAKEVDDDSILVTVKVHCGDHEVVMYLGHQASNDDITGLNFNKVETLGGKFEGARFNLIIGTGIVFAVLIFIAFSVSRFKYIHDWMSRKEAIEKEEREYKEKVAVTQYMSKSARNASKRISTEQAKAAQVSEGTKVQCISAPEEIAVESESVPVETVTVLATAVAVNEEPQLDSQMLAVLTMAALVVEGEDPGSDGLIVKSLRRRGNSERRRH